MTAIINCWAPQTSAQENKLALYLPAGFSPGRKSPFTLQILFKIECVIVAVKFSMLMSLSISTNTLYSALVECCGFQVSDKPVLKMKAKNCVMLTHVLYVDKPFLLNTILYLCAIFYYS